MNRIVQFNTYLYLWQKKKHMKAKVCLRELKAARLAMLNNRSAPCTRDQKSEMFECY